jgi:hypothetical protein
MLHLATAVLWTSILSFLGFHCNISTLDYLRELVCLADRGNWRCTKARIMVETLLPLRPTPTQPRALRWVASTASGNNDSQLMYHPPQRRNVKRGRTLRQMSSIAVTEVRNFITPRERLFPCSRSAGLTEEVKNRYSVYFPAEMLAAVAYSRPCSGAATSNITPRKSLARSHLLQYRTFKDQGSAHSSHP